MFTPGANNPRLAGKYNLNPLYSWAINYFPYNFNSTADGGNAGKIFSQLYFRQAVQYLVDQPAYIKSFAHGYGVGTYGPVPSEPQNAYATSYEKTNPYPYNPSKAKSPAEQSRVECGRRRYRYVPEAGHGGRAVRRRHPQGRQAGLRPPVRRWPVADHRHDERREVELVLRWHQHDPLHRHVRHGDRERHAVQRQRVHVAAGELGCRVDLLARLLPIGEEIFQTGAGSNSGSYSNPTNDANIKATNFQDVTLSKYENYLAQQLPVVYQPNYANPFNEIATNLKGATPLNVLQAITPENWRWAS